MSGVVTAHGASAVTADRQSEASAWWAYGGPFAVFGVLTMLEGQVDPHYYPFVYLIKVFAVTIALVAAGAARRDITPSARVLPLAIAVGLGMFAAWVGLDTWVPYPHLGSRTGFNPFQSLSGSGWPVPVFLAVRFYGLVLMVPVMEELFMRSFLLRYFTNPRVDRVATGEFTAGAFALVAALSALSHPEWLVAAIASAVYALLLRSTRSLFAVVVAHAVTNAALGIYVVTTGNWRYW